MGNRIEVVNRETDVPGITEYGLSVNNQPPDRWYRGEMEVISSTEAGVTVTVSASFTVLWPD